MIETYGALLRASSEVVSDQGWQEQVREQGGMLLSIDGIQPDKGNETVYLVREVLTGRMLLAEPTPEQRNGDPQAAPGTDPSFSSASPGNCE